MDFASGPRRTKTAIQGNSKGNRNKGNKFSQFSNEFVYIRRGAHFIRKKCCRSSAQRPGRPGILQYVFCCTEEGRKLPANFESSKLKYTFAGSTFQNGNFEINNGGFEDRRMGFHTGLTRCIPSYSSVSISSSISPVLCTGSSLPVSCNALRPGDSASDFHEGYVSYRQFPAHSSDLHTHVSRRLVSEKSRQENSTKESRVHFVAAGQVGTSSELEKVQFGSVSNDTISGSNFQFSTGTHLSDRRQTSQFASSDCTDGKSVSGIGSVVSSVTGTYDSLHRFGSSSTFAHATNPVLSTAFLETSQRFFGQSSSHSSILSRPFAVVENTTTHFCGSTTTRETFCYPLDRCICSRLGSTHGLFTSVRQMGQTSSRLPHKLAGNESGSVGIGTFQTTCQESVCSASLRQFDSGVVYQQARRNEVVQPLSFDVGVTPVVPGELDCFESGTYSRETEYFGRRFEPRENSNTFNRVEFESGNSGRFIQNISNSKSRSVCNKREQETSSLLFPLSGPGSNSVGCTQYRLDRDLGLCLPTSNINSFGSQENSGRTVQSTANCASSSESALVSSSARVISGFSKKTSAYRQSSVTKQGSSVAPKPSHSKSRSLGSVERQGASQRFSAKAQQYISESRRSSTRKLYNARLAIYREWCRERHVDPCTASIVDVADFLVYIHDNRKCGASTVAGYRTAISTIHKGWNGHSVGTEMKISQLIKGMFNSRPVRKTLLPNWDLPSVLWKLCDPPFEPLESADLKFLTWKTVFLLAVASAARVGELHALSIEECNIRFEGHGVRLLPNLNFLAKTQRLNKPWKPFFIPRFGRFATEDRDRLLCPCRSLHLYLARTKPLRKDVKNLFITYQDNNYRAAAKSSLSRWIVSLIRYVYDKIPSATLSNIRAHDTRRLSSSWALFNGVAVTDIMEAAHWSSENTFTSFYLKDVCHEGNFARASVLETAKLKKGRLQ